MPNQGTYANVAVMLHHTGIPSDPQKMATKLGSGSGRPTDGSSNYAKSRGYAGHSSQPDQRFIHLALKRFTLKVEKGRRAKQLSYAQMGTPTNRCQHWLSFIMSSLQG